MSVPLATMRLQLHRDFTFADAIGVVPYLATLGVSHLYASPILTARPGSMHGYDVIDPTRVNPELGGEAGLRDLVRCLREAGIGLIVDIVPNHMAAGGQENPWWGDVLRLGRASPYAAFFDIDWERGGGKLLAPFLGEPYGEALRSGTLSLATGDGVPEIRYYDTRFPVRPDDHAEIADAPAGAFDPTIEAGRERLHRLLERQHYRLAWWRSAGDLINWRRFFDINGLAGVRVEDPPVFDAVHETLLRLYGEGLIDGVRVDHVDGLADPPGYCRRLRERLDALAPLRPPGTPSGPAWLVIEKILGAGETLPGDWNVHGTSGYDFMDEVGAVLHDAAGAAPLRRLWSATSGRPADFAVEEEVARREVLDRAFAAQRDAAVDALHRMAMARLETRDVTPAALRRALGALLAHFPVYRSYGSGHRSEVLTRSAAAAAQHCRPADRPVLGLLERWLGQEATPQAAIRFQQLSAPLAAKAVEDTAFYRYGVLLSRNEVGADIHRFAATPAEFHAACLARLAHFPDAMLATATHDHKRGEDVRARLAVLSEIPSEWQAAMERWFALNAPHRRFGDAAMAAGDEAMLYQMIVGAWPGAGEALDDFTERLAEWQLKALREAKLATDWEAPDLDYEEAARSFLYTIMNDRAFVTEAETFVRRIEAAGVVNGLAQTLLKLTVPGVPDFYQGTEFWDRSLVDPDNRRPVDFARRIAAAEANEAPPALAPAWRDGRVKQAVIRRALALRTECPDLFARGSYRPLAVAGAQSERVVAFARADGCVVVVPRLVASLLADARNVEGRSILIPPGAWGDTVLHLPDDLAGRPMRDRLSGAVHAPLGPQAPVAALLGRFPLALLVPA
ncbi:MAG: malto-oligosyltrehalose synthase [Acetobacteraceae bacterium]